jgi:hypothetical protein
LPTHGPAGGLHLDTVAPKPMLSRRCADEAGLK